MGFGNVIGCTCQANCRSILESLPEGDEGDHEVWSRSGEQAEIDEAADDGGDDDGE